MGEHVGQQVRDLKRRRAHAQGEVDRRGLRRGDGEVRVVLGNVQHAARAKGVVAAESIAFLRGHGSLLSYLSVQLVNLRRGGLLKKCPQTALVCGGEGCDL